MLYSMGDFAPKGEEIQSTSPWWFILIILFAVVIVLWWILSNRREKPLPPKTPQPVEKVTSHVDDESTAAAVRSSVVETAVDDDLTVIEGIGPKISGLLKAAGIKSFAQLAASDQDTLRGILNTAGLNIANPGTWAEQAGLAAAGDWEGLKKLTEELKGGRRV